MQNFSHIKGLLIDIDDTITRFKLADEKGGKSVQNTGSLMTVLQQAGVELAGLTPEESAARMERVKREVRWWYWSDFIMELGLNPKRFWDYAYDVESRYLEATGPEIAGVLQRLHDYGTCLYITSNNPNDGVLHKLRVAGLAHNTGSRLFDQLLGVTSFQCMKWDEIYWKRVLCHTALDPHELAVVGDNVHDDYELPHSCGIGLSFIINRFADLSAQNTDSLIFVRDFDEIARYIQGA